MDVVAPTTTARRSPLDLVTSFAASARLNADRPLFGVRDERGWRWITYGEIALSIDAFRASLARLGVRAGDRVAIIANNRPEWAIAAYASFGLGAAVVPLYEAQLDADRRHVLADSVARVAVVANATIAASVAALRVATLEHTIVIDADADAPFSFERLVREGAAREPAVVPEPSSIAEIVYTSGTTGVPKGVLLTHANVVSNLDAVLEVMPLDPTARSLSFLPWAHVFGGDELHGMIRVGASMALCDGIDRLGDRLLEVRPTCLFAVPRVWNKLYQAVCARIDRSSRPLRALYDAGRRVSAKARRHEHLTPAERVELAAARRLVFHRIAARFGGRLQYAVSSAATLAPEVAELMDDLGIVVLEGYGMTETSACATLNPPGDRRIGTVGKAVPGVRIAIDPRVGGAEGGEIVVYGHGVMAGYHGMPEETARTLQRDGGLRTGDLGRLDEDGYLRVTGRVKELYKLENGKYVAPAPIEERLTLSGFIAQAFVHGTDRPHDVALIVPSEPALRAWAADRGIDAPSLEALLVRPEVRALFADEIAAQSGPLREYERVRAFAFVAEPFSTDNGLLTPTLKTKRRAVEERYRSVLASLYAAPPTLGTRAQSAHA